MGPELWDLLATVFTAGGGSLLVTLLVGTLLVPFFRRVGFVSRESKEGVARGRTDLTPMGGGFILLLGVTLVVSLLTALGEIRRGYAACFLIAFWGFGLLGYLDDQSKVSVTGYSEKVKVLLQFTVTFTFAVSFYWYYREYVNPWDLEYLVLPFIGRVALDILLVPFVMFFLFWVSNAVNITDGFNGLAGGTGAIVALAYAVVTFLIGATELANGMETEIAIRMFALSRLSAVIAGALLAYLYFNFVRGAIFFGDTGSMALGAALAFLAVFSRTEFLFCVIAGVFFIEAGSVFLQRTSVWVTHRLVAPLAQQFGEPFRPFIIAPLHHHFEHLLIREREQVEGEGSAALRAEVREWLTRRAWLLGCAFALIGVFAEYGQHRRIFWIYNWLSVTGVLFWLAILAFGILTRFLYDCYFIGPDLEGHQKLMLYRGIPWAPFGRRLFGVYEATDIPLAQLGYLERRTGLFHLFFTRVDARIAFGLLQFQVAEKVAEAARDAHFRAALSFWEKVPQTRYLTAERHDLLRLQAVAYEQLGHRAKAVEALEALYSHLPTPEVLAWIEQIQGRALERAERAYAEWVEHNGEIAQIAALAAHEELLTLLRIRYERARRFKVRLARRETEQPELQRAVENQIAVLKEALTVAAERCDRLQPEAGAAA